MKKIFFGIILLTIFSSFIFADYCYWDDQGFYYFGGWNSSYQVYKDEINCVIKTNGGYILAGTTYRNLGCLYMIKTNSIGQIENGWPKVYNNSGYPYTINSIIEINNGYVLVGECDGHLLVITYTTNWEESYSFNSYSYSNISVVGYDIVQAYDGGYVIIGKNTNTPPDETKLIKLNSKFIFENSITLYNNADKYFDIDKTADGGYIVVGLKLWKLDSDLEIEWTYSSGGSSVCEVGTNSFAICGNSNSSNNKIYLSKINVLYWFPGGDPFLDREWKKYFDPGYSDQAFSVVYDPDEDDGGFVVVGCKNNLPGNQYDSDVYILKTDKSGDTLWETTLDGNTYIPQYPTSKDVAKSVILDGNNYIVAGYVEMINPYEAHDVFSKDGFFFKISRNGLDKNSDIETFERSATDNISSEISIENLITIQNSTLIKYQIQRNSNVEISVYNMLGQRVKTLYNNVNGIGSYEVSWDWTDNNGIDVSNGAYFIMIKIDNYQDTKAFRIIR